MPSPSATGVPNSELTTQPDFGVGSIVREVVNDYVGVTRDSPGELVIKIYHDIERRGNLRVMLTIRVRHSTQLTKHKINELWTVEGESNLHQNSVPLFQQISSSQRARMVSTEGKQAEFLKGGKFTSLVATSEYIRKVLKTQSSGLNHYIHWHNHLADISSLTCDRVLWDHRLSKAVCTETDSTNLDKHKVYLADELPNSIRTDLEMLRSYTQ